MHHASLPGAHRAERDGPPHLLRFLGEPPRQLGQMLGSPPPIVFDVNHHPTREPILAAYDQIHDVLESVEGLPPPAYEHALAIATHLEHDSIRVRARSHLDGAGDTKAREDILEGALALASKRLRRPRRVRRSRGRDVGGCPSELERCRLSVQSGLFATIEAIRFLLTGGYQRVELMAASDRSR